MEKITKEQRYMQGKRKVSFAVNEQLFDDFKRQLEKDGLSQKEVLETAIYQYINGDLRINKIK